jgi:hypothetical protein
MKPTLPHKTLLILFMLPLMLACKALFPAPAAKPTPTLAPTSTQAPATATLLPATPEATATAADTPTPAPRGLTLVRLDPSEGDLAELLAAEVQKAAALNQMPVVEFDAPW